MRWQLQRMKIHAVETEVRRRKNKEKKNTNKGKKQNRKGKWLSGKKIHKNILWGRE